MDTGDDVAAPRWRSCGLVGEMVLLGAGPWEIGAPEGVDGEVDVGVLLVLVLLMLLIVVLLGPTDEDGVDTPVPMPVPITVPVPVPPVVPSPCAFG